MPRKDTINVAETLTEVFVLSDMFDFRKLEGGVCNIKTGMIFQLWEGGKPLKAADERDLPGPSMFCAIEDAWPDDDGEWKVNATVVKTPKIEELGRTLDLRE